jgi:hypothetical protein
MLLKNGIQEKRKLDTGLRRYDKGRARLVNAP